MMSATRPLRKFRIASQNFRCVPFAASHGCKPEAGKLTFARGGIVDIPVSEEVCDCVGMKVAGRPIAALQKFPYKKILLGKV